MKNSQRGGLQFKNSCLRSLWIGLLAVLTSGCLGSKARPHLFVIAVDGLGFDSVPCETQSLEVRSLQGLELFCNEGLRFTHAFTSSIFPASGLASLLTGSYPIHHGLREANDTLKPQIETLAEVAQRAGIQTGFFSGGAPIFRATGLNQGFESFDDFIRPSPNRVSRSSGQTLEHLLDWVQTKKRSGPLFGLAYLNPHLDTPQSERDRLGELTKDGLEVGLKSLSDSLFQFVEKLKAMKLWDSSYVVLVGLNGQGEETGRAWESRFPSLNLHSERTQVALFLKVAGKKRDEPLTWKVDRNVSLLDLAPTFREVWGLPPVKEDQVLQGVSLASVVNGKNPNWDEQRLILSEAVDQSPFRSRNRVKYAIRKGFYLYFHDSKKQIFNSLSDHQEQIPLNPSSPLYEELMLELGLFADTLGGAYLEDPVWLRLVRTLRAYWADQRQPDFLMIESLFEKPIQKVFLLNALAQMALQRGDWSFLEDLGQAARRGSWRFVARKNKGLKSGWRAKGCYSTLHRPMKKWGEREQKSCGNERSALALVRWGISKEQDSRSENWEELLLDYYDRQVKFKIEEANLWTTYRYGSPDATILSPNLLDLYFALPENHKLKEKLMKSARRKYENIAIHSPFEEGGDNF